MFRSIFIFAGAVLYAQAVRADELILPGHGFNPSRYETLWTKSPFAVASPENAGTSPDYSLVGLSRYDGISYASLIDKQSQERFLLSSDKPVKGLTLVSISHGRDEASNYAVIQRGGELITLKLEASVAVQMPNPANGSPGMPQNSTAPPAMTGVAPPIPIPNAMQPGGNTGPGGMQVPPHAVFRRRPVIVPPPPTASPSPQQGSSTSPP